MFGLKIVGEVIVALLAVDILMDEHDLTVRMITLVNEVAKEAVLTTIGLIMWGL